MNQRSTQISRDLYYGKNNPTPAKSIKLSTALIIGFACLFFGVIAGTLLDSFRLSSTGQITEKVNFDSLNEVYSGLADNYSGKLDQQKLIEEAKRGMVNGLDDPYSYYMTAEEYQEFDDDLNGKVGAGIGIEMGWRDNCVKVLRTTPNNPAREAGVLAGDIIYKINDESAVELDVESVAQLLRGEAGSEVKLTVLRDGEEHSFQLKREIINDESVYLDYRDDVAVLTITRFDKQTGELAEKYAQEIIAKGSKGLVLDLRNNGGGYVDAAIDVASLWIDGKLVTSAKSEAHPENNQQYNAKLNHAILADLPTIVLVNGGTASASEILTGALKDHGIVSVYGEQSFGKGCMQVLLPLSAGSYLRVTIADWYTPKGQNISEGGITPDKIIERSYEQINHEQDPQMDAALDFLRGR